MTLTSYPTTAKRTSWMWRANLGGRLGKQPTLQITMHPMFIRTLSHKVVSSKRGSHVPKQVRDNTQSLHSDRQCQKSFYELWTFIILLYPHCDPTYHVTNYYFCHKNSLHFHWRYIIFYSWNTHVTPGHNGSRLVSQKHKAIQYKTDRQQQHQQS